MEETGNNSTGNNSTGNKIKRRNGIEHMRGMSHAEIVRRHEAKFEMDRAYRVARRAYDALKARFSVIKGHEYFLLYTGSTDSQLLYWFIKEKLRDESIEIVGLITGEESEECRNDIIEKADTVLRSDSTKEELQEKYGKPTFTKDIDKWIGRAQEFFDKGYPQSDYIMYRLSRLKDKEMSQKARESLLSYLNGGGYKISNKCCNFLRTAPLKQFQKNSGKNMIIDLRNDNTRNRAMRTLSRF